MGETSKARERRRKEGWYGAYIKAPGIDIGGGIDCLDADGFFNYDINWTKSGDATFMADVADESYQTVYASHILEHLDDPKIALQNWFRILKPGGYLIICVPHRELYEKKISPPSQWNPEHKTFWLPSGDHRFPTIGLLDIVKEAIPEANVVSLRVLDEGFDHSLPANVHSVGEYSIEVIVKK